MTASSRILVLGGQSAATQAELSGQEASAHARGEREARLQRLRTAAAALAKRSGDRCAGQPCQLLGWLLSPDVKGAPVGDACRTCRTSGSKASILVKPP